MIRFLAGLTVLSLPATVLAHASEDKNKMVRSAAPSDMILVIASGNLAPTASDRIENLDIVDLPAPGLGSRIENRIRDEAGIVQFRRSDGRSAHPTSQGITLRGLGGNASSRALLTLDGIPQADPFGGWIAWSAFDAINLGGMIITRGGGSGADGPAALAGTIALHSTMTEGTEASIAAGSRNGRDLAVSTGGSVGRGKIALDGRYSRGDGFIPIRSDQRGGADRPAPFEQGGLGLRLRFDGGASSRVETSLRGFADRRDRGVDFTTSRLDGLDASIRFISDPADATQWLALGYVQLREFQTGFASVASDRSSAAPVLAQQVPATGLGARIEVRPQVSSTHPLRVGIDWRRTEGRTEEDFFFTGLVPNRHRSAGGTSDTLGSFAEWTSGTTADEWIWTASARLDRWWLGKAFLRERSIGGAVTRDLRFMMRTGWEAGGRIGVRWKPDDVGLRAAIYRGWRLPTLNELYRPFRVGADTTLANEMLEPEQLWGGEVGADWGTAATTFFATFFVNRLSSAIANVTIATNLNQRQNLDAINSKGVELSAVQYVGPMKLQAAYVYTDARVEASGMAARLDGQRPAQIARHGATVTLSAPDGARLAGFARMRYAGKQNEDDLGLQPLADALTIDLGAKWRVTEHLSVEARAENLLDELVPASVSGSGIIERATPRTLWFGARLGF